MSERERDSSLSSVVYQICAQSSDMATSKSGMTEKPQVLWLVTLLIAVACLHQPAVNGELEVGFYDNTCTRAEGIVKETVRAAVQADSTIAASLIRLHFHDCFVQVRVILCIILNGMR